MKRASPRYTRAPTQEAETYQPETYFDNEYMDLHTSSSTPSHNPHHDNLRTTVSSDNLCTDRENLRTSHSSGNLRTHSSTSSASTSPRTSRPLPADADRRNASCYHDTSPTSPSRPLPSNPYSYCRQRSNTVPVDDITPESSAPRARTPVHDDRTFSSASDNGYHGNASYGSNTNNYQNNGNSSNHGKNPLSSRSYSPSYYSDQPIETEPHVRRFLSPNPSHSPRNSGEGRRSLSPNSNVEPRVRRSLSPNVGNRNPPRSPRSARHSGDGHRSPRRSPKGRRSPRDLPDLPQSPEEETYSDEVKELATKIEKSMKETTIIMERVLKLQDFIKQNNVKSGDKNYMYLDEMLTRCLLELDNVQTHGVDEVRKYRKDVVGKVQEVVATLETIKKTGANPLVMYDPAVRGDILPMTSLSIGERHRD